MNDILMNDYQNQLNEQRQRLAQLNKKYNWISMVRLSTVIVFLICLYFYYQNSHVAFLVAMIGALALFIFFLNRHFKISWERKINKALIEINRDEINFLNRESIPFDDGAEFLDVNHAYAHDLDIFGKDSLFQHLNRTATFVGRQKLAALLSHKLENDSIIQHQEAVKDLRNKLKWRQNILALAKVNHANKKDYQLLVKWSNHKPKDFSLLLKVLIYIMPVLFFGALAFYIFNGASIFLDLTTGFFLGNLIITFYHFKQIKAEIIGSDKINEILKNFSLMIASFENESFESEKLKSLKSKLKHDDKLASQLLQQLSDLFGKLDTILNLVIAVIFNGLFLYHLHVLRALYRWKNKHAQRISTYLETIGEIEALNSLANFSFNNPNYAFAALNSDFQISFEALGHPMLRGESRVDNNVAFDDYKFMILTGSNMSGKSTFLRALGINMVLAGAGAPVCARKANIHPLKVLVSMRLADSLSDSESYFFAEVKRLKEIMLVLETETCFVLLDEILRGTNSDDKRKGTIGVIKKLIKNNAIGAIATHDLEVCLITDDYPNILSNQCFEVEIVNNELAFDYKLRAGICKNKSATFLMEKMEII